MEGNRIEKSTDLLRGVTLTRLDRLFASGDKEAHTFVVGVTLGNSVVSLDNTTAITGHFIRSDDSTLPVIKGTVKDGKAVLTLPDGAYKLPGYFSLIIKANVNGMSCAVFWGDGEITRTSSDTIVDPDHTIPSLDELLAKIGAIDDAIERAEVATQEAKEAAQSANFKILDQYNTLALLKSAHPTGKPGDAYAVGAAAPYIVYIWGVDVDEWVNIGQLQGAQGPQGPQGPEGVGVSANVTEITGGHRVTIESKSGTKHFDVMDGKDADNLLPDVTNADAGKFLRVSGAGAWAAESVAYAEGANF